MGLVEDDTGIARSHARLRQVCSHDNIYGITCGHPSTGLHAVDNFRLQGLAYAENS